MQCDWTPASRLGFSLGALVVLVIALGVPPWLLARAPGDRKLLAYVWLGTLALGILFLAALFTVFDGWSEFWWVGSLAVGLVIGLVAGANAGRRVPSLATLGVIGIGTPAAIPFALLFGLLAVTGTCFD